MLKTLTGLQYVLVFEGLSQLSNCDYWRVHSNFAFSSQGLWPLLWYVLNPNLSYSIITNFITRDNLNTRALLFCAWLRVMRSHKIRGSGDEESKGYATHTDDQLSSRYYVKYQCGLVSSSFVIFTTLIKLIKEAIANWTTVNSVYVQDLLT